VYACYHVRGRSPRSGAFGDITPTERRQTRMAAATGRSDAPDDQPNAARFTADWVAETFGTTPA